MKVTIIRHGRTLANDAHLYSGRREDSPLSPTGIQQAKDAGADPDVEVVYVTKLQRTAQTASLLFPNARQVVIPDFAEMDFGDFEGRNGTTMYEEDPVYKAWVDAMCTTRCPNGEIRDEFTDRVCRAFDQLVCEEIDQGGKNLTIVAHGGTIMAVLSKFAISDNGYFDWQCDNCGGYSFTIDDATWKTRKVVDNLVRI